MFYVCFTSTDPRSLYLSGSEILTAILTALPKYWFTFLFEMWQFMWRTTHIAQLSSPAQKSPAPSHLHITCHLAPDLLCSVSISWSPCNFLLICIPSTQPAYLHLSCCLPTSLTHSDSHVFPSRTSHFVSKWLHLLRNDSLLVQVLLVLGSHHTASSHVYRLTSFSRVGP